MHFFASPEANDYQTINFGERINMKKIEAYIKASRLNEVIEQLHEIEGLTGVSTFAMHGFGRTRDSNKPVRIMDVSLSSRPHVKLEIMCHDDLAELVVSTITTAAHTGLRGDGKVYISSLEQAIRIATGERGETAL